MRRPDYFGVPLTPNDTAAPLHCQGLWRVGKDARSSRREEESAARFPNLTRFSLERRCKESSSKTIHRMAPDDGDCIAHEPVNYLGFRVAGAKSRPKLN